MAAGKAMVRRKRLVRQEALDGMLLPLLRYKVATGETGGTKSREVDSGVVATNEAQEFPQMETKT